MLSPRCSARFRLAWRRWLWVLSWTRAHFRGSWGSVGGRGLFLRFRRRTWAFSGAVGAGRGEADSSADPRKWLREVEFKGLHRCRICCSWTSLLCQWVWRLQVVS